MEKQLTGKVALVTGASSGIGKATATLYAQAGATVILSDIDEGRGNEATEEIRRSGAEAAFVTADVSNPAEVEELVRQAVIRYGRLDIAFNNAGIGGGRTL